MDNENKADQKDTLDKAAQDIAENKHQDLSKESLGHETEQGQQGESDSPYKLKGLDDKRPEDSTIEKGWTVDSNTSRGPQDLKDE